VNIDEDSEPNKSNAPQHTQELN